MPTRRATVQSSTPKRQPTAGLAPAAMRPGPVFWGLGLLGLSLLGLGCSPGERSGGEPPSVWLISLDTLRQDHCGFHGYERNTTPFLDELAAESLVFDEARSTAAWTLISHMTMLSGLYPSQHRVWEAQAALSPQVPTAAEILAGAGAYTAGIHYPGWLDPRFGFGRGFEEYRSATLVDEAKVALDALTPAAAGRWSFVFLHLFDIHSDSLEKEGATIYDVEPPYDRMFDHGSLEAMQGMDVRQAFDGAEGSFTPRMRDAVTALYDGGIRMVDDRLKEWFQEWRASGLLDNAIIIITSDHGEALAQREPRFGGHGEMYEEGLRVPLLIHTTPAARRWLEAERGITADSLVGRRSDVVSHVDLLPTMLDAFDIAAPLDYPGVPLLRAPVTDRFVHAQRPPVFVSYRGTKKVRYDSLGNPRGYVDLETDPAGLDEESMRDKATIAAVVQMTEEARADAAALPDPGAVASSGGLNANERAQLEAIGYGAKETGGR